ncbi:MAG: cation transporter, partial [Phycisphaerae bacterium]
MPEDASGAARVLSDGVSPGGGGTVRLRIHGMTCGSCVARVERALRSVTGVGDARVNLTTEVATIELGTSTADRAALVQAIRDAGYDAETFRQAGPAVTGLERTHEARLVHQKQAFVQALALGVPIVALQYLAPVLQSHGPGGHVWPRVIQAILAALLLASSAGAPILVGGLRAVTHGSANMDLLVSLGVVVAFVGGVIGLFVPTFHAAHFHAVGMILAFINLGRYFEIGAKRDASGAISALVRRMPTMAQLVTDDTVAEVPIASIRVGDRVRVAQDMLVPVDGRIVDGHAAVDESAVTGEALPRPRRVGDSVCSGSVVADGLVTVEATHVGAAEHVGYRRVS